MDIWQMTTTVHHSTNWAIEGNMIRCTPVPTCYAFRCRQLHMVCNLHQTTGKNTSPACERYQDRYPAPPTHIFLLFHNKLMQKKIIQISPAVILARSASVVPCISSFLSVVVITCASHAQGRRFDPGRKQAFIWLAHKRRFWFLHIDRELTTALRKLDKQTASRVRSLTSPLTR